MNKFRVRRWLKLHPEQEIIITSEHYKRLGDIGLLKIIILGSYKDKIISYDPQLFEVIQSSLDSTSLSKLFNDFTQHSRERYLDNKKKPTHYT
ncbi:MULTISPECIES: hypothetical protein [Lysinibacillus]|uniref:hypothetical protein n=1 Tax=Lysinibacillus TaxID=400634 RepID=UPI001C8C16D0|nr:MULTISPECIES: hypothetical protein [Lysinibacillus]WHP42297.1 hypothetical protein QIX46_04555 [Lysinibacillus boronitolerans]MBX8943528.1 hypothetical protein [Lysinibacillus sp. K60]UUV27400.1 hypothetical protein NP781_12980 [Lysinibacillus sp. FN11]UYB45674.1 hypothetical protein OCI51_15610 [Lysinibacillus capsici]WDU77880.1 hypothetical protein PSR12_14415 [Lysinibacillus sp. G01H]